MRVTCRSCGATGSIDQVFGDAEAAEALLLAGELEPALARAIWPYLALFRPQQRAITWPRTRKLLAELVELTRLPHVRRNHRDWTVTVPMWIAAIEQMLSGRDRLTLPLKSHGYLLEIVAGLADKAEGATERERETQLRERRPAATPAAGPARLDIAALELNGERERRRRFREAPMTPGEEAEFLATERGRP